MKKLAYESFIKDRNSWYSGNSQFGIGEQFKKIEKTDNFSCHLIGDNFGEQLITVKLNIVSEILFNINKPLYIEFPNIFYKNKVIGFTRVIFSPYNYIQPSEEKRVQFTLFRTNDDGSLLHVTCQFGENEKLKTIDNIINGYEIIHGSSSLYFSTEDERKSTGSVENIISSMKFAVNCVLYVTSGQPDLRTVHPPKPSYKSKKGMKKFLQKYPIGIPIINVGMNYKKHIIYSVDGCTVSGHFRWQPCGHKLCTVKLIWINEHMRHYENFISFE